MKAVKSELKHLTVRIPAKLYDDIIPVMEYEYIRSFNQFVTKAVGTYVRDVQEKMRVKEAR